MVIEQSTIVTIETIFQNHKHKGIPKKTPSAKCQERNGFTLNVELNDGMLESINFTGRDNVGYS